MLKKLLGLEKTVGGAAIIIAGASILSRLIGLLRDRLLSSTFGAGQVLDAYYAAFRLPDLVFNTLVLGALSSAFIPVFLEAWSLDKKRAWQISNSILNILFLIIIFVGTCFFIFAPGLVGLIVPGFGPETRVLTISLTRVMLIGILFFTLSNVAGSILKSFRKFIAYSIAPIMYNLGIIFGILVLVQKIGPIGLAWGVVFGSAAHFLVQLPSLTRTGYRWKPDFKLLPAVKKIGILMLPRCFSLAINQFNLIVTTFIGSGLVVGAIAVYNLAFNLISLPVNIFGVSLATSVFPVFSQSFIERAFGRFRYHFSRTLRRVLYFIIPVTLLFIALRAQIVRIILGAGQFGWRDTIFTARCLGWFSVSLFAQALIPVVAQAFFARRDTKTPVKTALAGFIINLFGCVFLGRLMGPGGLALAFTLASIVNFSLLYWLLGKRVKGIIKKEDLYFVFKLIIFSAVMIGFVQVVKYQVGALVNMQTFFGVLIQAISASIIGALIYFFITLAAKVEVAETIWKKIKSR